MKINLLKTALLLFIAVTSLLSCDDDDEVPAIIEPTIFNYSEGGNTFAEVSNPYATAGANKIFGNNASVNVVEITLQNLAVGVYTIGETNQFKYTRPGTTSVWTAISGTVTILENENNKISGSFDLTAGNSDLGINSVSGSFKRVTVNP